MRALKKTFTFIIFLLFFQSEIYGEVLDAPFLRVEDFNKKIFDINDHHNKAIMVLFWAQWCGYCRKEMLELDQIYELYKDKGLIIIALSIDSKKDEEKAIAFARKLSYPNAFFKNAKTNFYNKKNIVPQIHIIDRKRTTITSITGYINQSEIIDIVNKSLF